MRIVLAGIALSVPLAGAPSAWALRYASPTGNSSSNCQTPATACDLTTAVHGVVSNKPAKGEEVIVEPGNYSVSGSAIEPGAAGMSVHGVAGKPRPVITGHTTAVFRANEVDSLSLGYLDIEEQGSVEALGIDSGVLERLFISGTPFNGNMLCQCYNGTLRDSVIVALPGSNRGAVGVRSNGGSATETLYNDTIYSEAALAPAIQLYQQGSSGELALFLNAYNTIAVNSAGGHDVSASLHGIIYMTHSDYASPTGAGDVSNTSEGGNVKVPPLFANAAAGDFRELVGSPTIDAGLNQPADGTLDFEGNPRQFGASTDIGAYEFSPRPTCNPLSSATAFVKPVTIQLQCADPVKAPLAYAIVGTPAHGTLSLTAATGQAVYTPAPGYSGPDSFSYDASSSHGTAAVVTASITVGAAPVVAPLVAPIISGLSQTAKRWREGNALARISASKKKLPLGTTFSFSLNVAARVTFQFTQRASGRRVGKKCVAQTNKNKNKRRCTRTVIAGTLTFSAHAGTNKVRFQGRISKHKKLKPGSYALLVTAAASGKHSATRTLHFTIVTS